MRPCRFGACLNGGGRKLTNTYEKPSLFRNESPLEDTKRYENPLL